MIDLIKQILGSQAGSLGFVFGIMFLGGWLIHFVTKKTTLIDSDHNMLRETNKRIEQNFTEAASKIERNVDETRRDLVYLKGTIDILIAGSKPLTQSKSPISLTEYGLEISAKLKADEIIAKNWEKIFKVLEENICDKNAYDIQTYCMEAVAVEPEKFFDKQSLDGIKLYAFKEGKSFQYYSGVFSVLIRDKYLQIKNIDISEVDANDPSTK